MINAIAEIGKYEKEHNPDIKSNFDIWLEDSYDEQNYPNLLLIQFKNTAEDSDDTMSDWVYDQVVYCEHSRRLKSKLLYKRGSPRGTDKTPTCKVAKSLSGTYFQKIVAWFNDNKDKEFLTDFEKKFISSVSDEINRKSDAILTDLNYKSNMIQNGGIVLSVVFNDNGSIKYIGNFDFFARFITEESARDYKYSHTSNSFSFGENQLCAICGSKKPEVYGYFSSLKFYNVDKPGMVTGGFNSSESWKNYPICLDCALNVEMGIKVLDDQLLFNFYGLRYYLIPKTASENARDKILKDIFNFKKSPRIKDKDRERITNAEDEVFEILQEEQNNVTFHLLFFEKPQKSVFRILALIEDVLPSRFKRLFNVKALVDEIVFFRDKKDGRRLFRFNYGVLRTFFPNSRIEGNHDKYFLEIVEKTFSDRKIDYHFIVQHIIYHLRNQFVQDNFVWYQALESFMLIIFLNELNLFRFKHKEESMNRQFYDSFEILSKEEFEEKVELFFGNFKEFFLTDVNRSIFLIGVLAQFVLNIQSRERGATPFRSKFKGLKMDGRDMAALVPEMIEKLEQYKANYYIPLEKLISKYLLSAGDFRRWNLSVDEMNYIFVLGMSLSKYFKIKLEEPQTEEVENV
ncbi:MAG TPA: TIGR02556 family CRISPR-associated protein [Candidatus Marinimicrobia bacterium]|nr:TIGR02556 family CRISPR-associated protein [Candidatus Neomarinimicrobiota bacterium]